MLVNTVNKLNDRLTFLGAPQNVQAFRFSLMQEKLRTTDENRVLIDQKYQDLLHRVSAGSAHHHIYLEAQTVRDAYASLDREYRVLREKYIRLKAVVDTTQQRTGACNLWWSHNSAHPPFVPALVPVVPSDVSRFTTSLWSQLSSIPSSVRQIKARAILHPRPSRLRVLSNPLRIRMEIINNAVPKVLWPRFVASSVIYDLLSYVSSPPFVPLPFLYLPRGQHLSPLLHQVQPCLEVRCPQQASLFTPLCLLDPFSCCPMYKRPIMHTLYLSPLPCPNPNILQSTISQNNSKQPFTPVHVAQIQSTTNQQNIVNNSRT